MAADWHHRFGDLGGCWVDLGDESRTESASNLLSATYNSCSDLQATKHNYDFSTCTKQAHDMWELSMKGSRSEAALTVLVPIPIAWLIAYSLIALVRWVRRGFQPST